MTLQNSKTNKKEYFVFHNGITYFDFTSDKEVKYIMDFRWVCPACAKFIKTHDGYNIFQLRSFEDDFTIKCPRGHKINMYLYLVKYKCNAKHVIHLYLIHILFASARWFIQANPDTPWSKKIVKFKGTWSPVLDTDLLKILWYDYALEYFKVMVQEVESKLLEIMLLDEGNNDLATMYIFEGKPVDKLKKHCEFIVLSTTHNNICKRPKLFKFNRSKINKEDVDCPIDPYVLDSAFGDIIIADYAETLEWYKRNWDVSGASNKTGSPALGSA